MKKLVLFLFMMTLCFANNIHAQKQSKSQNNKPKKYKKNQAWDAGLLGGITYYNGELHCPDKGLANIRPGGGFYTRYAFNDNFFGRANFQFGQIEGTDAAFDDDWRRSRNFSFNSVFYDAALLVEWEPFGKYRYSGVKRFNRMISPYIHLGAAGIYTKPKTDYNEPNSIARQSDINTDKANKQFFHFAVPLGGGVRYDLNKSWILGIEGGFRVVFSDYIDGVSAAGNPLKNDWYETLNLSIGYRFPYKKDKDNDGIPDEMDNCPDEAGTSRTKGCPDNDSDGVPNKSDNCPDEAGTAKTFGCPDSDGDNIIDKEDECPQEKGSELLKGCPDKDEDGISDKDDKCPDEKGTAEDNGCPVIDTDKDGIPDKEDKCPEMAGIIANLGCPDSLGVDSLNVKGGTNTSSLSQPVIGNNTNIASAPVGNVPSNFNTTNTKGATTNLADLPVSEVVILDENGKKVTNKTAKSTKKKTTKKKTNETKAVSVKTKSNETTTSTPSEITTTEKGGAIETNPSTTLTAEDQKIIDEAINGVFFDTNKATLKTASYATLSKVATVIKRYPNLYLRITGHTDDVGDDLENVKLSVARARAIYNYFLKKGIDIRSIMYRGCGDGTPIEDNTTAEGRAKNRRVEFDMLSK
jgi:outer membrane protein OmpA-like peptidoglycan-associated protein